MAKKQIKENTEICFCPWCCKEMEVVTDKNKVHYIVQHHRKEKGEKTK